MLSITSNNLGVQGSKIMNIVGALFLVGAVIVAFQKGNKD